MNSSAGKMDIYLYDAIIDMLMDFFRSEGYINVPAQTRQAILSACEDPENIATYSMRSATKLSDCNSSIYPLPQTGQMILEEELLKRPSGDPEGVFCITTSYRNEKHPMPGRHERIFPMFEFEGRGDIYMLIDMLTELLDHLGFEQEPATVNYEEMCKQFGCDSIGAEEELLIQQEYGDIVFLSGFPMRSHPFWNMKRYESGIFAKLDVLLYGVETFGTAERSTDIHTMRRLFHTISNGDYANKLFELFGEDRVENELDQYLRHNMFERYGGGIGLTRLARALTLGGIITPDNEE